MHFLEDYAIKRTQQLCDEWGAASIIVIGAGVAVYGVVATIGWAAKRFEELVEDLL